MEDCYPTAASLSRRRCWVNQWATGFGDYPIYVWSSWTTGLNQSKRQRLLTVGSALSVSMLFFCSHCLQSLLRVTNNWCLGGLRVSLYVLSWGNVSANIWQSNWDRGYPQFMKIKWPGVMCGGFRRVRGFFNLLLMLPQMLDRVFYDPSVQCHFGFFTNTWCCMISTKTRTRLCKANSCTNWTLTLSERTSYLCAHRQLFY